MKLDNITNITAPSISSDLALPKPADVVVENRSVVAGATGQHMVESPPPVDVATAVAEQTDNNRSNMSKMCSLVPVDKQAEFNDLLLKVLKEVRETGEPIDPRRSKLAIGKATQYRRSERKPLGSKL